MKIALLSDRSYPYFKGGAEKRYWEIAKRLTALGNDVHFFTGQWPGMPQEIVIDGITLHGTYKVKCFYVDGHKSIKELFIYTLSLIPYLFTEKFDLIECEQFPVFPIFIAKMVAFLRNKPLIVTWHEVWDRKLWIQYLGVRGLIGSLIERIAVHLPDQLIAVSLQTTTKLVQQYGVHDTRITTIPNGIDLELICSGHPSEKNVDVIYLGRLIDHKRVDVLLDVIQYAKQSHPNIQCLIIGDGPERTNLEKQSKKLGIEESITFLGKVKSDQQVYALLKSARVLVLPSVREGFGIAVIEANACGIPAIVIDHVNNAACDLVTEGINGYICELDPQKIGQTVIQILDESRQKYQAASYRTALAYSWDAIAKNVEKVYLNQCMLPFEHSRSVTQ